MKAAVGIDLNNDLNKDIKKMYFKSDKYDLGRSYKYALNIINTLRLENSKDLLQGLLEYEFYNMNPIALKSIWNVMNVSSVFKNDLKETLLKYSKDTCKYLVDIDYYLQDSLGYEFLGKEVDWMFDKIRYQHKVGGYFLTKEFTGNETRKIFYIGKKDTKYTVIFQEGATRIKIITIENKRVIEEKYAERVLVFLYSPFENPEWSNELVYALGIDDMPIDLDWLFNLE